MALTLADVSVAFRGDFTPMKAGAAAAGEQAGKEAGNKFSEAFNEAGKKLIAGYIGAELILKSVEAVKSSIEAAREATATEARLQAALKSSGAARADNTEEIEKQIARTQQLGFSEEETKTSIGTLVIATHNLDKAMEDQNLAMDLARTKNISLQEASQQLVAVEAGRFRGLAQLGIHLDANATKEQALAAVRAAVSGQAVAFANTDAGAQARLDAALENLSITVGQKLLPIMTNLANFVSKQLVPGVSALLGMLDQLHPVLEGLAVLLTVKVVVGFVAARTAALGFGTASTVAAAESATAGETMANAGAVARAGWLPALAVLMAIKTVSDSVNPIGNNWFDTAKMTSQTNDLVHKLNALNDEFHRGGETVEEFGSKVRALEATVDPKVLQYAREHVQDFTKSEAQAGITTEDFTKKAGDLADQFNALLPEVGAATDAVDENAGTTTTADEYTQHYAGELALLAAQYATAAAQAATSAEYTDHYGGVTATATDATAALRAELEATYGITISDANAALFLARGMDAAAIAAQNAAAGIAAFRAGHPTNAHYGAGTADAQVQFNPGSVNTETSDFDPEALIQHNIGLGSNYGYTPPKTGGGHHKGSGKSAASKAAEDDKKAVREWVDEEKKALQEARNANEQYLGYIHEKNLKRIASDRDAAMKSIDANHKAALQGIEDSHNQALKYVDDRRKEAQANYERDYAAIYAPIRAEEARLAAQQYSESISDVQKQIAEAQAAGDAAQLEQLNRQLRDLEDQHNLESMRATADAAAAELDAKKKAGDAGLDDEAAKADKAYDAAKQAESDRYDLAKQAESDLYDLQVEQEGIRFDNAKAAYQKQYDALVEHLDKLKGEVIDPKLKAAALAFRKHGENAAEAYAAGIISKKKVIETAAAELAKVISDFLETHSPARRGPLSRRSPEQMGAAIAEQLGAGFDQQAHAWQPVVPDVAGRFFAGSATAQARGLSGQIGAVDRSINVTQHFPLPERAEDATRQGLQLLAATGIFG